MKRTWAVLALFLAGPLLGSCGGGSDLFEAKPAPDEFAVYTRAPLSLPPDFALRPPAPGAERPQSVTPRDQAQKALQSRAVRTSRAPASAMPGGSPGLQALLRETGSLNSDPEIRTKISQESSSMTAGDTGLADRLLGWTRKKQPDKGVVIDPELEARRIKSNQAQGLPVSSTAMPKITRSRTGKSREKGFWDSFF